MVDTSFEQLFNEHVRYVGRALRYLGVKESDLEDACQEVFIVVHRRRGELAPQGDDVEPRARAWIRQICVNVASNARRTVRRRREDALESGDEAAHAATQESHVEREQMRGRLLALLETLREEQRTVFVLYEIEQLAMQEIASIVGCPVQTAYARLHAARARVAEGLQGVSAKHKEPS